MLCVGAKPIINAVNTNCENLFFIASYDSNEQFDNSVPKFDDS